jgi:serine/threonine protein kinase
MTSYEVPLEHDFVSPEMEKASQTSDPSAMLVDSVHRKMTAKDFEPITCLGKGTFGTVHLVKQSGTGRLFAQKMFRKASLTVHKSLIEQTKTERTILESINRHPFVVKLYYAFQDQEKLYLILEYAEGGELFTHLATERMFPEETAAFYMAEMVLALEHLHHTVGVVYRDLKPENCLLDAEGHLLLTDFGLSKVAVDGSDRCTSILGTIEYMAPEVILGHAYGTAVDWWSFGALGFDLLTGAPPFPGNNHAKIQEKILKSKLAMPYFLGPDAKDLLTRFLRKEPHKRLGANMPRDMQTIKKHRFFRRIDWKALERRELEPPIRPLITDPALAENFSAEFTSLALSPVVDRYDWAAEENNPFGGFSFVASKSLLAHEGFL